MFTLKRIQGALPSASMAMAILALVVAAAGTGYAAATIGTKDIKNGAVTSAKVKDASLQAADLVKESKFRYIGRPGAPAFRDGGQGDCVWRSAAAVISGIQPPAFRKDRFGTIHLVGVVIGADGPGGDASCDGATESEDPVIFVLPQAYRPARTLIRPVGPDGSIIVVGPSGLFAPGATLPPGAVAWAGDPEFGALLDGISYQPAGSRLVAGGPVSRTTPQGRRILERLGLG
ncbi:hypothetical protein [Nocardioides sambongensis]|uniref:hypothetical protein n=1 Tax=Nocardioides sambongensis TaxID=2589074 RepID=UPI00112C6188|nr:hypothetical protein [Nocardioides sambongensis]